MAGSKSHPGPDSKGGKSACPWDGGVARPPAALGEMALQHCEHRLPPSSHPVLGSWFRLRSRGWAMKCRWGLSSKWGGRPWGVQQTGPDRHSRAPVSPQHSLDGKAGAGGTPRMSGSEPKGLPGAWQPVSLGSRPAVGSLVRNAKDWTKCNRFTQPPSSRLCSQRPPDNISVVTGWLPPYQHRKVLNSSSSRKQSPPTPRKGQTPGGRRRTMPCRVLRSHELFVYWLTSLEPRASCEVLTR